MEYLIDTISTNCRLLLACSVLKFARQRIIIMQVNQKYLLNPEALFSSFLLYSLINWSAWIILTRMDCSTSLSYFPLCELRLSHCCEQEEHWLIIPRKRVFSLSKVYMNYLFRSRDFCAAYLFRYFLSYCLVTATTACFSMAFYFAFNLFWSSSSFLLYWECKSFSAYI